MECQFQDHKGAKGERSESRCVRRHSFFLVHVIPCDGMEVVIYLLAASSP